MMTDIIVVTSCKDLHGGIAILDAASGASISPPYKGCIAEKNCVTIIGKSRICTLKLLLTTME